MPQPNKKDTVTISTLIEIANGLIVPEDLPTSRTNIIEYGQLEYARGIIELITEAAGLPLGDDYQIEIAEEIGIKNWKLSF